MLSALRLARRLVTDSAGHDIPVRLTTAATASCGARPPVNTTKPSPDSCLVHPRPGQETGKEKDPGSAFGPESVPLATGLVPVRLDHRETLFNYNL